MNRLEARIRDSLAKDLSFLSSDFCLLATEYHLKNAFGTRGRIDILAKDQYDNFVIIELKRSNQAAREAIHEALKYAGLLKQQLSAKPSEIRVCIVSVEWDELIVPFSEFSRNTLYPLDGYQIVVDECGTPVSRQVVEPLPPSAQREFSPIHLLYLFRASGIREHALDILVKSVQRIGILDYVLLKVKYSGISPRVIYPFGLYLAFQRYSQEELQRLIVARSGLEKELEYYQLHSPSKPDLLFSLEQLLLSQIELGLCNDLEMSSPDGLVSLVQAQNWEIEDLTPAGFFAVDPRPDRDKRLISEIKGAKGGWDTRYHDYCSSRFPLKLQEMKEAALKCLWGGENQSDWHSHVALAFAQAEAVGLDFEVAIDVYKPKTGILNTLYQIANFQRFGVAHPLLFLPNYILQIHYSDEERSSRVLLGRFKWSGKHPRLDKLLQQTLKEQDLFTYVLESRWSSGSDLELLTLQELGLSYVSAVLYLQRGELHTVELWNEVEDSSARCTEPQDCLYIEDFFQETDQFLAQLTSLYSEVWHSVTS